MAMPMRERDIDHVDGGPMHYMSRVLDALQRIERRIEALHVDMEELRRELRMRTGGTTEPHRGMAGDLDTPARAAREALDELRREIGGDREMMGDIPPTQVIEPNPEPPAEEQVALDDTPHVVGSI